MDESLVARFKLHIVGLAGIAAIILVTSWDTGLALTTWFRHPPHPGHIAELPAILVATGWDTITVLIGGYFATLVRRVRAKV